MKASIREEDVLIPSYKIAEPEKSPLFIEKRAYQGSSGKVYPLPVTERIYDEKELKSYRALILENDYIYVMILPELGGRIHRAYDKTNGYDFVYYNRVIKPALVGLAGPWISGGIEFNWPQHHRPSTFSPVDYACAENPDGSVTAFVGETDVMYGTKGMAAITLYPDKAYIQVKGQLYNPTDFPQTFLWWANPAVAVNDSTFSVFPPDVNAVMDHGKRAVATFPIATGEYYKYDYSAGVDISRYKNIQVPTSYMAAHSDFDFVGNFDEGRDAGLLHVADHHISPGKKQWTWGCGDFGRTWDKNLTDEDGPYIELMTGVFTDNQPDFTWLKPHEEKSFVQYFMPYKGVGRVSNATRDIVIGVDENRIKLYSTGVYRDAVVTVACGGREIYSRKVDLSPEKCFVDTIEGLADYYISVRDSRGGLLGDYREFIKADSPVPEPAEELGTPEEIKSTEELWLAGQHLEQYRHATYDPADYYLEGLRRNGSDIRLNNAYGLLLLRGGRIKESVAFFERAIAGQTRRNPNPYSGECFYNLGVALEYSGETEKAYDAFYKATWSAETQAQSFYHLACIQTGRGRYAQALEFAESALVRNSHSMKTRTLMAELMALLGMDNGSFLRESHEIDRLSMGILHQLGRLTELRTVNCLKLSLDYMQFGLYERAVDILNLCAQKSTLAEYYKGYAYRKLNDAAKARECFERAEAMPGDYVFPNTLEELLILESAIEALGCAPMAEYYLGNLLYDKRRYEEAAAHWRRAVELKPDMAMAQRNLSIAYYNKAKDAGRALEAISAACRAEPQNSRFLLEKDQLLAKTGAPPKQRLAALREHPELLEERDALCLAYITLLNETGRHVEALELLFRHRFHVWEGGEGKVAEQYKAALFALAEERIEAGDCEGAFELAERTITYPENLGEGKLPNVADNRAHYIMGRCCALMGDRERADRYFTLATAGEQIPAPVRYYNDQSSDYIYYQGLAFYELEKPQLAKKSFNQLIAFGRRHIFDRVGYDFFAVSLPEIEVYQDDMQKRSDDYCRYLARLGEEGLKIINKK